MNLSQTGSNSLLSALLLTGSILLLSNCANRKIEASIPTAVTSAFAKTNPNADDVEWEIEGANFEVEYEIDETEYSELYSASGKLLESEKEISVAMLPAAVRNAIDVAYAGKKIKEAAEITFPDGRVEYEAEIDGKDLFFDANGMQFRTNMPPKK